MVQAHEGHSKHFLETTVEKRSVKGHHAENARSCYKNIFIANSNTYTYFQNQYIQNQLIQKEHIQNQHNAWEGTVQRTLKNGKIHTVWQ